MSSLLREISEVEVNKATKNGGASAICKAYAAQLVLESALCVAGHASSCANATRIKHYLDTYC